MKCIRLQIWTTSGAVVVFWGIVALMLGEKDPLMNWQEDVWGLDLQLAKGSVGVHDGWFSF